MTSVIEFLLVGRRPLGSAIRAAVLGALAVTLGRAFFAGWWAPLVFGVVVVLIVLPLVYLLSGRDNSHHDVDPYLRAEEDRPPRPGPRDVNRGPGSADDDVPPGSLL